MRLAKWSLIAIVTGGVAVAGTQEHRNTIPPALADYRSWTQLTAEPRPVPYELSAACMPPAPPPDEQTQKRYGPHRDRWLMVYANPAASAVFRSKDIKHFPTGAMIAKEKLSQPVDDVPDGVAFMIKRANGQFAKSGGWEFLYFPSTGPDVDYQSCANCHRAAARKDYVFSTFAKPAE